MRKIKGFRMFAEFNVYVTNQRTFCLLKSFKIYYKMAILTSTAILKDFEKLFYWSLLLYQTSRAKNSCFYNISAFMVSSAILKYF